MAAGLPNRRPRIGLLGGSFNPAHAGHRHISRLALSRLTLDQVWWLVSPQNPLKSERGMASRDARLTSAQAVALDPRIVATAVEAELGTRFTVDTVAALKRRLPRARFVWLMGADNLIQLPQWHRWQALMAAVPIAIFDRPSYSRRALASQAARRFAAFRLPGRTAGQLADRAPPAWVYVFGPLHGESASRIRRAGSWPT